MDEDAILARACSWPDVACCDCEGEKGDELALWFDGAVDEAGTVVEMGGSLRCIDTCARKRR